MGNTNSDYEYKYEYEFGLNLPKMTSPDDQRWVMSGQDIIFEKIMMMVGLSCLESLRRCEQVCRTWNAMIMRLIWESPSRRNIFKMRIEKRLYRIDNEDVLHAKWLGKKNDKIFDCQALVPK